MIAMAVTSISGDSKTSAIDETIRSRALLSQTDNMGLLLHASCITFIFFSVQPRELTNPLEMLDHLKLIAAELA